MKKKIILIVLSIIILAGLIQTLAYKETPGKTSIELSNGIITYDKYGSGENIIIAIHGSPGGRDGFDSLGPQIENSTLYALDMYGFGESEKHVSNYGMDFQSDVILEFMNKLNIEKATLLGYSWGGLVAIDFARKYPDKTDNLILLASSGIQEGEPTKSYLGEKTRTIISYPFVVYYPGSIAGGIGWRKGFIRSFLDSDQRKIREYLKQIQNPVLIIHGNKDTVIEPWVAEEHHLLLQNSQLKYYNGGHGQVLGRNTSEMAEIINNYLNEN